MTRLLGFPPIADTSARLLIVGTMPSVASLRAGQYYAHPRNALWRILGAALGIEPGASYPERCARLCERGVALWDVFAACRRDGSLDATITDSQINDFAVFFAMHPHITHVCFNGALAERAFRRRVLPTLGSRCLDYQRLPSTSPAHAARSFADKLLVWRRALATAAVTVTTMD